jgi:HSP20 family protein
MANITRYDPFRQAVSLREAMDRLFEDSFISPRQLFGNQSTSASLYETNDSFTLQVPMPGVKPDDVEITIQQNSINLKWAVKTQIPENATVHWSGWQEGQFQQSFSLPTAINNERVEAQYNDGILTLHLPKAEHAKARTIKVKPHQTV